MQTTRNIGPTFDNPSSWCISFAGSLVIKAMPIALLLMIAAVACGPADVADDAAELNDLVGDDDAWDAAPDSQDTRTDDTQDIRDVEVEPPLGVCGAMCGGDTIACPEGAFCEYGVLDITHICTTSGCGLCAWIPSDCPPEDDPVCACNGEVYDNPCERRMDRGQPDISWSSCPLPEPEPDIVEVLDAPED
jgi:hypothetical protein